MNVVAEKTDKIRELDPKDRHILNILSENAREKLTTIARKIQLSVDSTKKRMQKLEKDGIVTGYTIQVNPNRYGLPMAIHIYVKLKNITRERVDEFFAEMTKNPRVIDLMSVLGDYDVYLVILAKSTEEIESIKNEMKQKFTEIIDDWKEVLVTRIYKLEQYRF